mgnify:CR=1 FL=1
MNKSLALVCSLSLTLLCLTGCGNELDSLDEHISNEHGTTNNAEASAVSSVASMANESEPSQKIPYVVSSSVRVYQKDTDVFKGELIQNKSQLDHLQLDDNYPTEKYSDEYFSEKALLMLYISLESGSMKLQIDDIITSGDSLVVNYTSICPSMLTADMAYWRVLLEVNSDDVKNIHLISGERNRETLPS